MEKMPYQVAVDTMIVQPSTTTITSSDWQQGLPTLRKGHSVPRVGRGGHGRHIRPTCPRSAALSGHLGGIRRAVCLPWPHGATEWSFSLRSRPRSPVGGSPSRRGFRVP